MLNLTPATFAEFEREAQRGNVGPVVRTVMADLQTPVGAFVRIAGNASHAFLLESIEGGERLARYSFLGADPSFVLRSSDRRTVIERKGGAETKNQNAMEFMRSYFSGKQLAKRPGLAPLSGGAVGYLAYSAASWFEPALRLSSAADESLFMFFRTVLAF